MRSARLYGRTLQRLVLPPPAKNHARKTHSFRPHIRYSLHKASIAGNGDLRLSEAFPFII